MMLHRCGDAIASRMAVSESWQRSCDRQVSTMGAHCFASARASHWTRPGCFGTSEEAMGAKGHSSRVALLTALLHHMCTAGISY